MTRYEYQERIKELKEQIKGYKELCEIRKVSAYLNDLRARAYMAAFDELRDKAQTMDIIQMYDTLNPKLSYINSKYKEHFPELLGDDAT